MPGNDQGGLSRPVRGGGSDPPTWHPANPNCNPRIEIRMVGKATARRFTVSHASTVLCESVEKPLITKSPHTGLSRGIRIPNRPWYLKCTSASPGADALLGFRVLLPYSRASVKGLFRHSIWRNGARKHHPDRF